MVILHLIIPWCFTLIYQLWTLLLSPYFLPSSLLYLQTNCCCCGSSFKRWFIFSRNKTTIKQLKQPVSAACWSSAFISDGCRFNLTPLMLMYIHWKRDTLWCQTESTVLTQTFTPFFFLPSWWDDEEPVSVMERKTLPTQAQTNQCFYCPACFFFFLQCLQQNKAPHLFL